MYFTTPTGDAFDVTRPSERSKKPSGDQTNEPFAGNRLKNKAPSTNANPKMISNDPNAIRVVAPRSGGRIEYYGLVGGSAREMCDTRTVRVFLQEIS